MREVYQNEDDTNVVDGTLEEMVREGARRMLAAALEEEVSVFLGRERYERSEEFRGYRNGYHPSRELTVGVSPHGFSSKIVRRYERTRTGCAVARGWRWRSGAVVGTRWGVPDHGSSTLLEPPGAERAGEVTEGTALGGETQVKGDVGRAHASRVRAVAG